MSGDITIIRAKSGRSADWTFTLEQDGLQLVSGSSTRQADLEREALHYANVYAQDGDVLVTIKPPRRAPSNGEP